MGVCLVVGVSCDGVAACARATSISLGRRDGGIVLGTEDGGIRLGHGRSGYALDVDFEDGIPLGRSGVGQDGICLGRLGGAEQDVGAAESADVLRHRPEQPLAGGISRQAGARR